MLLGLFLVISDGAIVTGFNIWLSKWTGDPVFLPTSNATNTTRQEEMNHYLWGLTGFGLAQSEYDYLIQTCTPEPQSIIYPS